MLICSLFHSGNAIFGRGLGLTQYASPTASQQTSGHGRERRTRKHDSLLFAARGQAGVENGHHVTPACIADASNYLDEHRTFIMQQQLARRLRRVPKPSCKDVVLGAA